MKALSAFCFAGSPYFDGDLGTLGFSISEMRPISSRHWSGSRSEASPLSGLGPHSVYDRLDGLEARPSSGLGPLSGVAYLPRMSGAAVWVTHRGCPAGIPGAYPGASVVASPWA